MWVNVDCSPCVAHGHVMSSSGVVVELGQGRLLLL
jgi:hypothetical protein